MKPLIPSDFGEWPRENREIFLHGLVLADPYLEEAEIDFLLNQLRTETSDAARSAMVFLVGSHIDEADVRQALENISDNLNGQSATRDALLELVVSARFDELDEVRFWGRDRLKAMEGIDSEDGAQFGPFLQKLLRAETRPDGLRKLAARGLAWLGEHQGLLELVELGESAAAKAEPLRGEGEAGSNHRWLLEIVIDAIGEVPVALDESGLADRTRYLLRRSQDILSTENRVVREAERRIEKVSSREESDPTPASSAAALETVSTRKKPTGKASWAEIMRSCFYSPFIIGTAVAAVVAVVVFPWLLPSGPPEFQELILTGVTREGFILQMGPTVQTRGASPDDFVLQSGEHLSISFVPKEDAFITVLLLNSRNESSVLFSDWVSEGERVRLPEKKDTLGYELDKNTGIETILAIASKEKISDVRMSRVLNRLGNIGSDSLSKIFPDAKVEILRFRHG
jgi:hypothetical protein